MLLRTINDDRLIFNSTPFSFLACVVIFTPKTNDNSKQQIKKDKPNAEQIYFLTRRRRLDTYNKSLCFCTRHG
jgi:hypothetical protein